MQKAILCGTVCTILIRKLDVMLHFDTKPNDTSIKRGVDFECNLSAYSELQFTLCLTVQLIGIKISNKY